MPYEVYKILHIIGLVAIWASLGGTEVHVLNGGTRATNKVRTLVSATHGVGLMLMLVGGFGMLARLGLTSDMPGWVMAKIVLWLVVGGLLAVPLRIPALARPLWFAMPFFAALGAWLALTKPF
ncbi:MAG: hypothetical protein Q8P18_32125 [Pseudomonadota bacterium]|nr:hypothetical protein [Pseudomonadota bacterium]